MNVKNKKNFIFILSWIILCTIVLSGCVSNRGSNSDFDSNVIDHTRRIAELESENKRLTGIIDSASDRVSIILTDSTERITDIRSRSSEISDSVDRIIYLFGEYDKEVQRLLREFDQVRSQIEISQQNNVDIDLDLCSNDSSQNNSNDSKN